MNGFKLKNNMLLGVASSALQIDGGRTDSSWHDWYLRGHIKDGADPGVATGHWERWREDILLMHSMGIETYRFSVDWARVEPEEGVFDENAIAHIKEELMLMLGLGIKPLITLHHFSEPMWFVKKGGWESYENIRSFLLYVEKMIKSLGHLANEYITINEPNVYSFNAYMHGSWPPGKKNASLALEVMNNMAAAHIKSYRLIHDIRRNMGFRDSKVSFTIQLKVFQPQNRYNPGHVAAVAMNEKLFQSLIARAMVTGEFKKPLKNNGRARRGVYCDFYAVDYYTRATLTSTGESNRFRCHKNDLGREIYPEGLVKCCRELLELSPMSIYITANGVCDLSDSFRSRFIYEQLKVIKESQLPIKRYYYWCFNDCFEWTDGNFARFGLVHTDFDTLERKIKSSGEFYKKMIENHGVTEEMYEEYVAGQEYHY